MLSATAAHALRAMTVLSGGGEGSFLARDISRACGVPAAYLAKILAELKKSGLIEAERGRGGGYRLGRPPREIRLIDVVSPFDVVRAYPGCLFEPGQACAATVPCSAHDRWAKVRDSYVSFLETTTLAQVARRSGKNARVGEDVLEPCFVVLARKVAAPARRKEPAAKAPAKSAPKSTSAKRKAGAKPARGPKAAGRPRRVA